MEPSHSPPFAFWQSARPSTMASALPRISGSPVAAAFMAAAESQWPRKWPRSWLVGDSHPQWMPSGLPGSDQSPASWL